MLAFQSTGGVSRRTATAVEQMGKGDGGMIGVTSSWSPSHRDR
ncbi:MAG: hypothetical protein R2838_10565 [Caldilineaceae bacterium]